MSSTGLIRQNYHPDCEAGLNKHMNMQLYSSYVYLSMALHFDRDDISSKGFYKFYKDISDCKREEAQEFMKYQNLRGGRIVLQDVKAPKVDWDSHLATLEDALLLEKQINESLLNLYGIGTKHDDPNMLNFLDSYNDKQVENISQISHHITNMKRCGDGLGVYQFDKNTMEAK